MLIFSEGSIAHSFKFPSDSPLENFGAMVSKLGGKKISCHVLGENVANKQMMLSNGVGPRLGLWEC